MIPAQIELRREREAIMSVEGATDAEIKAVWRMYPELYGIEDYEEKQESLI
jgi:hypothetical protein